MGLGRRLRRSWRAGEYVRPFVSCPGGFFCGLSSSLSVVGSIHIADWHLSLQWNLILHGRSTARLQPLIDSLSAAYPTQIFLPLVANASKSPEELDLAHEVELLKAKHCVVTLLINNAGVYRP